MSIKRSVPAKAGTIKTKRPAADSTPKRDKHYYNVFFWWRTDPAEIEKQVVNYDTLQLWKSARGISLLLSLFSVIVTVLMGGFMGLSVADIVIHTLLWGGLGYAMLRGYHWAFAAAMVLWTFEKGTLLFAGGLGNPIVQIIWWAIYMSAFMLGFRVELERKQRRRPAAAPAAPPAPAQ